MSSSAGRYEVSLHLTAGGVFSCLSVVCVFNTASLLQPLGWCLPLSACAVCSSCGNFASVSRQTLAFWAAKYTLGIVWEMCGGLLSS